MNKRKLFSRFSLICFTGACFVTFFALILSRNTTQCDYSIDGGAWRECANDRSLTCDSPAISFEAIFQLGDHHMKSDVVCPWSKGTAALGITSFVISACFLAVYIFNPKVHSFKVMISLFLLGLISVILLIATFVLMIIEIVDNVQVEKHYDVPGVQYKMTQVSYIINAVFVGISFIVIMLITFFALRSHIKSDEKEEELIESQISCEKPGSYAHL